MGAGAGDVGSELTIRVVGQRGPERDPIGHHARSVAMSVRIPATAAGVGDDLRHGTLERVDPVDDPGRPRVVRQRLGLQPQRGQRCA